MRAPSVFTVLRKQYLVIVAGVLLGVMVAALVSLLTTTAYQAQATLYVSAQTAPDNVTQAYQGSLLSEQRVQSYVELITGDKVVDDVTRKLGSGLSREQLLRKITVTNPAGTVLIRLDVEDSDPATAGAIADALGSTFIDLVSQLERSTSGGREQSVVVRQISPAAVNPNPVAPDWASNIAVGFSVGVLLGLAAALVRNAVDTRLRSAEEVASITGSPSLGSLPFTESTLANLRSRSKDTGGATEASARIRTGLQYIDVDNPPKAILFTSAEAGEGKTTTCLSLAVALARAGRTVLVVDADLRRPRMADALGVSRDVGLTSALVGKVKHLDAVSPTAEPRLFVLPSGPTPPNPSELLASHQMSVLTAELRRDYDYVLLDGSPLLPVTDSAVLAPLVDGVIVIARYARTRSASLERAIESLSRVSARVLGTVMAGAPRGDAYGYYEEKARGLVGGESWAPAEGAASSKDVDAKTVGLSRKSAGRSGN